MAMIFALSYTMGKFGRECAIEITVIVSSMIMGMSEATVLNVIARFDSLHH